MGLAALSILGVTLSATGFENSASATSDEGPELQQFQTIYEPSGVQQLPDGRILVIEDENLAPFSILTLDDDGKISARALQTSSLLRMVMGKSGLLNLGDLEGIDVDDRGYVYAITSHSRTEEGKRAKTRERLIRFRLDGNAVTEPQEIKKLRRAITKKHPELKDAARIADVKDDGGFNIEGLSFDRTKQRLLIALRSPVIDGNAVIVVMENPDTAFEKGVKPKISDELIYLDLAKGGIRAIVFDPMLDGYLIASHREDKKHRAFKLWFWDGEIGHAPRRVKIAGKTKIPHAEGITPVHINGEERLLIVFDDGNMPKRKGGHYLMLNYEHLSIDPKP